MYQTDMNIHNMQYAKIYIHTYKKIYALKNERFLLFSFPVTQKREKQATDLSSSTFTKRLPTRFDHHAFLQSSQEVPGERFKII